MRGYLYRGPANARQPTQRASHRLCRWTYDCLRRLGPIARNCVTLGALRFCQLLPAFAPLLLLSATLGTRDFGAGLGKAGLCWRRRLLGAVGLGMAGLAGRAFRLLSATLMAVTVMAVRMAGWLALTVIGVQPTV